MSPPARHSDNDPDSAIVEARPAKLERSRTSSLDDEKKVLDDSYATTLEADELSVEALHVYDDERLKD